MKDTKFYPGGHPVRKDDFEYTKDRSNKTYYETLKAFNNFNKSAVVLNTYVTQFASSDENYWNGKVEGNGIIYYDNNLYSLNDEGDIRLNGNLFPDSLIFSNTICVVIPKIDSYNLSNLPPAVKYEDGTLNQVHFERKARWDYILPATTETRDPKPTSWNSEKDEAYVLIADIMNFNDLITKIDNGDEAYDRVVSAITDFSQDTDVNDRLMKFPADGYPPLKLRNLFLNAYLQLGTYNSNDGVNYYGLTEITREGLAISLTNYQTIKLFRYNGVGAETPRLIEINDLVHINYNNGTYSNIEANVVKIFPGRDENGQWWYLEFDKTITSTLVGLLYPVTLTVLNRRKIPDIVSSETFDAIPYEIHPCLYVSQGLNVGENKYQTDLRMRYIQNDINCDIHVFSNTLSKFATCPFLYLKYNEEKIFYCAILETQEGIYNNKITITPIDSFYVKNQTLNIYIKEEKDEISYIDYIYLKVDDQEIKPSNYVFGEKYTTLKIGEELSLDFTLPETYSEISLISKGYYITI